MKIIKDKLKTAKKIIISIVTKMRKIKLKIILN